MIGSQRDFGIIPRSFDYLLKCIPGLHQFKLSCFEIYNENIKDLLSEDNSHSKPITIQSTAQSIGAHVANLEAIEIDSVGQFNEKLNKVVERRKKSATARNASSSRSHAVIQIGLEGQFANKNCERIKSSVTFLDLAGCENFNDHLDTNSRGTTQNEMTKINQSLNNFHTVIESLRKREPHTDFRSSKLTHFLKPCLTLNTKTIMITTISQEKKYLATSKASLAITESAGKIQINDVKKNLVKT